MRLAGVALFLLGCGSSFSAADASRGGSAGMAGAGAGSGGSTGEATGGAGAGGTLAAGSGGAQAGSGGEATGGAGMSSGGAGAAGIIGVAGAAGSPSLAGAAGAGMGGAGGGAPMCGKSVGSAAFKLIDDLEDGDDAIDAESRRVGFWSADTETPSCERAPIDFAPDDEVDNGSGYAAHMVGGECGTSWLGLTLNECGGEVRTYDATALSGITFSYKSTQPLRIEVLTRANLPVAEGGDCIDLECGNHHGKNFEAAASWVTGTVTWAELRGSQQIGTPPDNPQTHGQPRPFKTEEILGVRFAVDELGGVDFEIWIDDVKFL